MNVRQLKKELRCIRADMKRYAKDSNPDRVEWRVKVATKESRLLKELCDKTKVQCWDCKDNEFCHRWFTDEHGRDCPVFKERG